MRLAQLPSARGLLTLTSLAALATAVASCSGGAAPELNGLTDQVAQVGTELKLELDGTSENGGKLSYRYHAADLMDLDGHAEITVSPDGSGVFRWTPLAADVGNHPFDFTVSNGSDDTTVTINIDVKSAIGSATAPIFRQPLGTGTTVDLTHTMCVSLDVVVEDQDTPQVKIAQEEPLIDGATLTQTDGQTAKWNWCPTRDQASETRNTLVLSADDMDNPKTIKNYLIVLRGDTSSCPGAGPSISHSASDQTTRLDVALTATVTDAAGLKDTPLFYYSTNNPGTNPDVSTMTQLSTTLASGDNTNGQYTVSVPNPVASASDGTSATIYYVFVADDHDTADNCDHSVTSQVYQMTITAGGSTTAGLCEACTADDQCGTGNECVYMGSMGMSYCLAGCGGGCATGYTCSTTSVTSVDGASDVQCEPDSGSCQMSTTTCIDDDWEVNDTFSDASGNPVMTPDSYDLVSCPSTTSTSRANDDYYKLVLSSDQRVDLHLVGDGASDLDLHLYHSDHTVVAASTSTSSDEDINTCLPHATYYVKVNGYGSARSLYTLTYTSSAESCAVTCTDDTSEPDDNATEARPTTYPTFTSTGNMICPNNDDWYDVSLYTGETVTIDLTFTQNTSTEDLDVHLYQNGTDLWPCDPQNVASCEIDHGQGATSNEHAVFTAPSGCDSGCDYDVVVRGWNGSTNSYGITIGIQ